MKDQVSDVPDVTGDSAMVCHGQPPRVRPGSPRRGSVAALHRLGDMQASLVPTRSLGQNNTLVEGRPLVNVVTSNGDSLGLLFPNKQVGLGYPERSKTLCSS